MKAVLLAAGKSTRTYPLTTNIPKPLLPIIGKEIISYTIDGLSDEIVEWYIILGFEGEKVQEYLKEKYPALILHFIHQKGMRGTGEALALLSEELKGESFIVLNGDDLYFPEDVKGLMKSDTKYGVLAAHAEDPSRFGVFRIQGETLIELIEKPAEYISNLVNVGVYKLHGDIFKYELTLSPRGEYEIVEYINRLLRDGEEVRVEKMEGYWLPITYPWDILKAQRHLLEKGDVRNIIPVSAELHSTAYIGQNVVIGEHCVIGENVELEDVCLFDYVKIDANSRIHGSVIAKNVHITETTIVDGASSGFIMLPIGGKEHVSINPEYKGIFTESHLEVSGFYVEPTFIIKKV